ncbi:MAG TPA: HPP family protein [Asticcacaulis sp.]|nr:HPP family protein [Asticcacaulis sp.]HTM80111.1 HPP family protein [Asticcacaulis sp.]
MGGVFIGIVITAMVCSFVSHDFQLKWWLMAPLGASAAQVFAVPGSPMSQPWPIVGGHMMSALSGLMCLHFFGQTSLAAALAVAVATIVMLYLRALHASGGGTALFMVVSGTADWHFILFPVAANAALLVLVAIIYHWLTDQKYPQRQINAPSHQPALHRFDPSDLEAALLGYNRALDISREEVEQLIEQTEMQAYTRLASNLTCGEIMTTKLRTIPPRTALGVAIANMQRYDIKALPVIDDRRKVMGVLRLDDALKSDPSLPAGQIMRQGFARVKADDSATELLHILAKGDRRHVMVVDDEGRLEGMVSKSDLMRALFHAS